MTLLACAALRVIDEAFVKGLLGKSLLESEETAAQACPPPEEPVRLAVKSCSLM